MDSYLIFTVILFIYVALRGYTYFKHKDKNVFEVEDHFIVVYPTKHMSFRFLRPLKIEISSIKTIQVAGTCISLFTKSGNATDVWIRKKHLELVIKNIQEALPNAELVEVDR